MGWGVAKLAEGRRSPYFPARDVHIVSEGGRNYASSLRCRPLLGDSPKGGSEIPSEGLVASRSATIAAGCRVTESLGIRSTDSRGGVVFNFRKKIY